MAVPRGRAGKKCACEQQHSYPRFVVEFHFPASLRVPEAPRGLPPLIHESSWAAGKLGGLRRGSLIAIVQWQKHLGEVFVARCDWQGTAFRYRLKNESGTTQWRFESKRSAKHRNRLHSGRMSRSTSPSPLSLPTGRVGHRPNPLPVFRVPQPLLALSPEGRFSSR